MHTIYLKYIDQAHYFFIIATMDVLFLNIFIR